MAKEMVRVRLCADCGGFLDCWTHLESAHKPPEGFLVGGDKRWVIDVPGHRDVSTVYGGGCECDNADAHPGFGLAGLPSRAVSRG